MEYDYIFAGYGLATLALLHEMTACGWADGRRILIIEPEKAPARKTWCFWETDDGAFDTILKARWQHGLFDDGLRTVECLRDGFGYKCLDSDDLRSFVTANLKKSAQLNLVCDAVTDCRATRDQVTVITSDARYHCRYFFDSIPVAFPSDRKNPLLLQHFEGWFIETAEPAFDAGQMTLMDFSIPQHGQTRFMYILPFSSRHALVEFTLFSPGLLPKHEYAAELSKYLERKGIADFTVTRKETGIIPMSTFPMHRKNGRRVLHIGTAGGWTKASTGYTFLHARAKAREVIVELQTKRPDLRDFGRPSRFRFYDRIFIQVLFRENQTGKRLFSKLFTRGEPAAVLRFLNEESSWADEWAVISNCPKIPFLKAFFRSLF